MVLLACLASFLFTTAQWWKTEKEKEKKLKTLPVLLLQLYPQYKAIRIIILWLKDDPSWPDKKLELNRDISHVGKD